MKFRHSIFLFFCLFIQTAYSQKIVNRPIDIVGQVADPSLEGALLEFNYYENYSLYGQFPVSQKIKVNVKNQRFDVKINPTQKLGYLRLDIPDPYLGRTIFLAEEGDQLLMTLKDGKVTYGGKNGDKYNCQQKMTSIVSGFISAKGTVDEKYFDDFFLLNDKALAERIYILDSYKSKLNRETYDLIKLNFISKNALNKLIVLFDFSRSNDSISRINTISYFQKFIKEIPVYSFNKIQLSSESYLDLLYFSEVCKVAIPIKSKSNEENFIFSDFFRNILNSRTDPLRDRMLASSILGIVSVRDSTDFYRDSTLRIISEPYSKKLLLAQKRMFGKGSIAFDFKLQDTTGKLIKLSDFKGKIVILDFYFTGCTGCASLAKGMVEVAHKYEHDKNVVFISINVDKKLEMFKSAVKSGKYTHPESINLYTNGKGDNHELIQYYNIEAYPVLMIIDRNGRILNGDPPYPNINRAELTKSFINIIENELLKS